MKFLNRQVKRRKLVSIELKLKIVEEYKNSNITLR